MYSLCCFFKQKTAYEMRISDWSSDVCSSDLFDDRGHGQAVKRAAVVAGDHHVLGDVDQATGQVTGVRGLQRGIREALSGAVGRDEVLQDVQAFAEVRGDRSLDDRAVRTRHQAAHARQLADLRLRTTRAGV